MTKRNLARSVATLTRISILLAVVSVSLFAQGKNPVILIPGITGSELKDKETGSKVWFRTFKSKSEDLRLPISTDLTNNHDKLVPGDVLRRIKVGILPSVDVYGGFVKAMSLRAGYHEEIWETPSENGYQDSLYVFPYDWRLDNVENARRLVRAVEELKTKLKKPDLKFDIVAHSMGGLIARYAAMYGDADLPADGSELRPTWAGARDFNKVILMGTPNEGSALSLGALLNGFEIGGMHIDLPFVQDTSRYVVFTFPSAFQLLPAPRTLRAYNDKLEPVAIDLYDPKVWTKYGWNPVENKDFPGTYSAAEEKAAPAYFTLALARAKRLHEALAIGVGKPAPVSFYVLGSDCKPALDSIVVYRDEAHNSWKTMFKPKPFTRSDGTKVTDEELKKIMLAPGDGTVTSRSLEALTESEIAGIQAIVQGGSSKYFCEEHNKLPTSAKVQDYIIGILASSSQEKSITGNDMPRY